MNKLVKRILLSIAPIKRKHDELEHYRNEQKQLHKENARLRRGHTRNTENCTIQSFIQIPAGKEIKIEHLNRNFQFVSTDTTNYCNARCIFCLNVKEEKHVDLTKEIFAKAIAILPFVEDSFLFSCTWEPTLNPYFIDLLEMIPVRFKDKVLFTSNLVRHVSDEDFHRLAKVAVNHIHVSLETLDKKLNNKLTGTQNSCIYDNLERMTGIFSKYPHPPSIRFITLILRDNYDELPHLAEEVYTRYHPEFHEFRTPYITQQYTYTDEMISQLLPYAELSSMIQQLKTLDYGFIVCSDGGGLEKYEEATQCKEPAQSLNEPFNYTVRIIPSGVVIFEGLKEPYNLNDINDPFMFYQERLNDLQKKEAASYADNDQTVLNSLTDSDAVYGVLENVYIYDSVYMALDVRIWSEPGTDNVENNFIVINKSKTYRVKVKSKTDLKPDIFREYESTNALLSCLIDLSELDMSSMNTISIEAAIFMDNALKSTLIAEIPIK